MAGLTNRWDSWARARPWVPDVLLAVALALVLGPTSLAYAAAAPAVTAAAVTAAILVLHSSVAARRTWPRSAYAAACAAMLVLIAMPDLPGGDSGAAAAQRVPPVLLPSALTYTVLLYSIASRTRRPWPELALGSGLVGGALATARLWQPEQWVGGAVPTAPWRLLLPAALVAIVLAAWGLGRFRAMRDADVDALRERALRAESDRAAAADRAVASERERMAREMHDVVAHSLAVIVRQAEGGRMAARRDPAAAVETLAVVADTGRQALGDMRSLVDALRPRDVSAPAAPQPTVDDVPTLVDRLRQSGVDVTLEQNGTPGAVERATALAVYRVVQESLTNVVKHAGQEARARVELTWADGAVRVEVVDDGGRGRAAVDVRRGGHGLPGMRERVELAGGTLVAGPCDRGFAVVADLPLRGLDGGNR
ncbi:sensor histidine kinase [Cellulomonas sp. URHE0023]|uniref:sensor histidine kinase n=1 Tax=Cellulomonas sp. URHE0023 TaxID=1380354 RepID=UPI00068DB480|nr:histidine kinase [Cellulomonas sp. URHE0023]